MKISPVFASNYTSKINRNSQDVLSKRNSFKGIYVDYDTDIGNEKEDVYPATFKNSDAVLLNEIARRYPNQDCFICKGANGKPRLEFRERANDVQVFRTNTFNQYMIEVNPKNKENPCVPLIIHENSDINSIIGIPSRFSHNPSLTFTILLGFELNKKLIEKKYQILDVMGENESIDLGGETPTDKAYNGIKELEIAVTRYLVECAFAAINDTSSASGLSSFNLSKVQDDLIEKRKNNLMSGDAVVSDIDLLDGKDVLSVIMERYPNVDENKKRIEEIAEYIRIMGISLDYPDVDIKSESIP